MLIYIPCHDAWDIDIYNLPQMLSVQTNYIKMGHVTVNTDPKSSLKNFSY